MSPIRGNRREKRIAAAVPIRLWGMDAGGHPFIEVARTINVSRSGALLKGVPAKLTMGDVIGLKCNEKKHRFRVVWIGKASESGNIGLQILDSEKWIWDDLKLPADEIDIYTRPPESERRQLDRARCFISAEVIFDARGQKVLAFIKDLSLGGCYVATTFAFPLEAKVSILMWLDEQTKLWVDGTVISSHPSSGMGLKFLGLSSHNSELIEQFIKSCQAETQSPRAWLHSTTKDKEALF